MKFFCTGAWALLMFISVLSARAYGQGVDNPLPMEFFVPMKVTLDVNEVNHFSISLPAGSFKIVLDTRQFDDKSSNIQSALAITDSDGAVVKDGVIGFNEIDWAFRKTYNFSLKSPMKTGFKLTNFHRKAIFWLVVLKMSSTKDTNKPSTNVSDKSNMDEPELKQDDLKESDLKEYNPKMADFMPFPFFGKVMPRLLLPDQARQGKLEQGESAYYITILPKGKHKVVVGFDNAERKSTNIQGYLAFLNADGGGQQTIIGFNEIDVSSRKTSEITLKITSVVVIRIENHHDTVNYSVKIRPAD